MAPPTEREAVGFLAQMALRLGRYNDMIEATDVLAEKYRELTVDEEQLVWTVYQNAFREKHLLLQKLDVIEEEQTSSKYYREMESYRAVIEFEMLNFCGKAVGFVENYLLSSCRQCARWNKMIGDLCWYQCKFTEEEVKREVLIHKALTAYKAASVAAESMLPAHPDRLSVVLNLSALYFDERNEEGRALTIAADGLDKALPHVCSLEEDSRRESTGIIGLIRENLRKWAAHKVAKGNNKSSDATKSFTAAETADAIKNPSADGPGEAEKKPAAAEPGLKLEPDPKLVPEPDFDLKQPKLDDPEPDAKLDPEPEPAKKWKTPYSMRDPSPVRARAVSTPPRLTFAASPPAEPEKGLTRYQIRQRSKASQARRGMMG